MRVGIVGTGFMGTTHAAAWSATPATLVGVASNDPTSAQQLAQQHGAQAYTDFDSLLDDVDVIDICTPTHLHYEMVLQAARKGKQIICEKPLARTVAQAQEMIAVCQEMNVTLLVAHVVRYFPEYAQAQAQVAQGHVGKTAVLRLNRSSFQPKKPTGNWFLDFDKSGGMILDLMIHDFDYARWLAGNVTTVFAKSIRTIHTQAPIDHAMVILTHENGTISHVEGSWAYPPPRFYTHCEIAGSDGFIQFDSDNTKAINLHLHQSNNDSPDIAIPSSPLLEDPYITQIKSFYNHLTTGAETAVTATDGLAALQIALAAIDSAQTGQPVTIQQPNGDSL